MLPSESPLANNSWKISIWRWIERMHYEVEQKYRVATHKPTVGILAAMDVALGEPISQVDSYYAHPQRDFAQTDEAFRLRAVGDQNFMTYKGPKIDQETKTRCEEEVRLSDGEVAFQSCDAIIRHLGFEPVAVVRKKRILCTLERDGLSIEIALDHVEGLGQFVEIEVSIDSPHDIDSPGETDAELEKARAVLRNLAHELNLTEVERRSYLELLLAEGAA